MKTIPQFLSFSILILIATSCNKELNYHLPPPQINEIGVTSNDSTSAECMMIIIDYDAISNVTRGFVCSTKPNPSLEDYLIKTEDVVMNGRIYRTINELSPETPYYIKAYAINSAGITYSEEVQFYTLSNFNMSESDYSYISSIDPIPHPRFDDQGYYFGANAHYKNFDMRLTYYHLYPYTWEGVTYNPETDDPVLYNIFMSEGQEVATDELYRRILEEAFISLLQHKFPEALPHPHNRFNPYVVGFEIYNNDIGHSYLEAEYRCIESSSGDDPPQFELVYGPSERYFF